MTNSKTTKKALLSSALALTMCVAMLIATTFAWFTDTASTSVNKIQAGTLKLKLEKAIAWESGNPTTWEDANGKTLSFLQTNGSAVSENANILWEPGCTYKLPELRISNEGNLALKYKIIISGIGGNAELNNAIEWTIKNDADGQTTDLSKTEYKLTAAEGTNDSDILTISGHMKEDAGNAYQDMTINNISITVIATQDTAEFDSTTNQYDYSALYPVYTVADVETTTDASGNLKVATAVTIESEQKITPTAGESEVPVATVEVPAGVVLEEGTDKLTFDIHETAANGNINITSEQSKKTLEIKVKGVASTNDKPLTISHYIEPGLTGLELFHNEAKMTLATSKENVTTSDQYYYNIDTGEITLASKAFSPFTYVFDAPGTQTVTTRDELEAALGDKTVDTIKLGANVSNPEGTTGGIWVTRDVTIDFNGHVLNIGLVNGDVDVSSPATNLTLIDSTNATTSGDDSLIQELGGGAYQQIGAVWAWKDTVRIKGGYYKHNSAVIGSQLQTTCQKDAFIIDGGTFVGVGNASTIDNVFGTITINDGKFTATHQETGNGECIYVSGGTDDVDSITNVKGGTFTTDSARLIYVKVKKEYVQKVNISDGTFTVNGNGTLVQFSEEVTNVKDYITITGGTFNVDPSSYVASGYTAEKDEASGTWTVKKAK